MMGTITIPPHCWNSNGGFSFRRIILRHFFFYSTSTTTTTCSISTSEDPNSFSSLANWLVDSLGFSAKQAISTSTKLTEQRQSKGSRKVCSPNLLRNADSVVTFLRKNGLQNPQIRDAVYSVPRILTCRIEQTLEPKMKFFKELGLSVSDFASVISTQHRILDDGLDSTIRPAIEDLRAIMGSDENVVRLIKGFRLNYLQLVTRHLVLNVSALQAQGIQLESIQKRILHLPSPFMRKPEDFKEIMTRAESKWGVSPRSGSFLYAVHVLSCLSEKTIESKCQVFENFGWDRAEVEELFRRNPLHFGMSEGNIRDTLSFFMRKLGYDPGYLLGRNALLGFSLEKRVVPRYLVFQILKEKGLIRGDLAVYSVMLISESQFLARYVEPFEDGIPDLRNMYTNSISSSTQRQNKRGKRSKTPFSRTKLKQV